MCNYMFTRAVLRCECEYRPDTILCAFPTRATPPEHDTYQQMHISKMLQIFAKQQCSTPDLVNFGNCQEPNPGTRSLSNYLIFHI